MRYETKDKAKRWLLPVTVAAVLLGSLTIPAVYNGLTGMSVAIFGQDQVNQSKTATVNQSVCRNVTYTEQQSYTETECQTIQYPSKDCEISVLSYSKTNERCYTSDTGDTLYSECTIGNSDTVSGLFYVNIGFLAGDQIVAQGQSVYLAPSASFTFKKSVQGNMTGCYCAVTSPMPTKETCTDIIKDKQDCRQVEKQRNVTKTKEVCE